MNGRTDSYDVQSNMVIDDFVKKFNDEYPNYKLGLSRNRMILQSRKTFQEAGFQSEELCMAFPDHPEFMRIFHTYSREY